MINLRTLFILTQKEFRGAVKNRWLVGFVVGFCVAAVGISWMSAYSASVGGYSGFGRTTAALINLILLIVPLMGLSIGSLSLVGERERGTLALLLSLPVHQKEIFWAKWLGLSGALTAALAFAFSLAGLVLILQGGIKDGSLFIWCFLVTVILALSSLSLGFLISSFTRRTAQASGITLLLWLVLVFGGDLGLLGTTLAVKLKPAALLASAWLNPLSLYRILSVNLLGAHLEMLGPAGLCAQDILGAGLLPLAFTGLILWIGAATTAAYWIYIRDPLREGQ